MNAFDYADTLKAKSDQLNADDLIGGPITVQITGASRGNSDQPLVLSLSGGHQPWRPCKTMRRLLAACVGSSSSADVLGRWVTLYRDPSVTWGGDEVGGVRLCAMSGLQQRVTLALQVRRGKKVPHVVDALTPPTEQNADDLAREKFLAAALDNYGLTQDQIAKWLAENQRPSLSRHTAEQLRGLYRELDPKGAGA